MAQVATDVSATRGGDMSGNGEHANRLFLGGLASMFATSFAFIVRAMLITDYSSVGFDFSRPLSSSSGVM